jgi:hypothetical protein
VHASPWPCQSFCMCSPQSWHPLKLASTDIQVPFSTLGHILVPLATLANKIVFS